MASTSASKSKKAQPSAEDSSAFGPIAERFRRAGDLERAVSLCREGLKKFPNQISARVTLGWALLELGKFDDARTELEDVLRRRPDNLAAIRALAELHDRSEQTLNLPMDGPGQWPPSADEVDEMAGGMIAGNFRSVAGEGEPVDTEGGAIAGQIAGQPAVVPPAELGLAMWSALPATEPAEPSHLSIAPTSIPHALIAEPVLEAAEPDADIAALLAEAESLDALADAPVPGHIETMPGDPMRASALSDVAFDADSEDEPSVAVVLDAEPDLEVLTAYATPAAEAADVKPAQVVQSAGVQAFDPEAVRAAQAALEAAQAVQALEAAQAAQTIEELTAGPAEIVAHAAAEPGFQLEGLSVAAVEAAAMTAVDEPAALAAESFPDPDTQPILRFDLEPVSEPVVAAHAAIVAVQAEPEPESVAAIGFVPTEQLVEASVISSAQARIAEVVAMAQGAGREPQPSSLAALEHFLARVQARRRTMAESVA